MECETVKGVLENFLDGALDDPARDAIKSHLEDCPACWQEAVAIRAHDEVARMALATETPLPAPELWPRIGASLDAEESARREKPERGRLLLLGGVAALAATVAGVGAIGYALRRSDVLPVWLLEAPVQDLRTFLASNRKMDIATADPEELRGWFAGRLTFDPPPPRAGSALQLVGGRLCYFLHRRGASYMYRTEDTPVSLFAYEGAGLGLPAGEEVIASRRAIVRRVEGFTHILWNEGPLIRSLVSTLPHARLARVMGDLLPTRS